MHCTTQAMSQAEKPMVILGSAVLQGADKAAVIDTVKDIAENLRTRSEDPDWKVFNMLQRVRDAQYTFCVISCLCHLKYYFMTK